MKLGSIARIVGGEVVDGADTDVLGLAYDSHHVAPGDLFICRRGVRTDGHLFAGAAVERGAVALLCERPLDLGVPEVRVADAGGAMNVLASPFFGDPSRSMKVAGITGTNGKTTIAFMLESIFRANGEPSGMIGTVESRVAGKVYPAARTTPEGVDVQRMLRQMVDAGVPRCAMEVTSIGLDKGRVEGTRFDVGVFTNLTHDHLDHHGNMEQYFNSKLRLFTSLETRTAVVNVDDPYGRKLVELLEIPVTTFGMENAADLRAEEVRFDAAGAEFVAEGVSFTLPVKLALSGRFNVSNALAAIAASWEMDIDPAVAVAGLASLARVPGRLEAVREGQEFEVYVDYAHTPDGLENVLRAAGGLAEGRVLAVFGCGGDRDRHKRPLMGRAAGLLADVVFATSDNPRSEDPAQILAEIEEGLREADPAGGYQIIEDREEAIRTALLAARATDVVVIAGKGHETGQERNGIVTPFDDAEVAARILRGMA